MTGPMSVGRDSEGRIIILNPDGSYSTERTETMPVPGGWINVPTLMGGVPVSPEESVQSILAAGFKDVDTGRDISIFRNLQEAIAAARNRSWNKGFEMERMF